MNEYMLSWVEYHSEKLEEQSMYDIGAGIVLTYKGNTEPNWNDGNHEYEAVCHFTDHNDQTAYEHALKIFNDYGQDGAWTLSRIVRVGTEDGLTN